MVNIAFSYNANGECLKYACGDMQAWIQSVICAGSYAALRLVPGQSLATKPALENRSERTNTPFPDTAGS